MEFNNIPHKIAEYSTDLTIAIVSLSKIDQLKKRNLLKLYEP